MSELSALRAPHDPADPDPALALLLDRSLPFAPEAKAALLRDQATRSRRVLLPLARPFARLLLGFAHLVHMVSPNWPHAPRLLHRMIAFGMRHFLTPDANLLILRHFHLGAQILRFISDNATPGFHPPLQPMRPRVVDDVLDNLFLNHDLNLYNFVIGLNQELERRGSEIGAVKTLDFSAISRDIPIGPLPRGRFGCIDAQTAIEIYTPLYALLLTDRDFQRAANSLQLDETIAIYAARLTGEVKHLSMVNNRHPLVPHSTTQAGFRLMLHGVSTELLHGVLWEMKQKESSFSEEKEAKRLLCS
jgi:hypothetical protein